MIAFILCTSVLVILTTVTLWGLKIWYKDIMNEIRHIRREVALVNSRTYNAGFRAGYTTGRAYEEPEWIEDPEVEPYPESEELREYKAQRHDYSDGSDDEDSESARERAEQRIAYAEESDQKDLY
jgi:hypothetical protein